MSTILIYLGMGLLGIIFKTLGKIIGLIKTYEKSNEKFVLRKFIESDAVAMAASFVFVVIVAFIADEWLVYKPTLANFVKTIFALVGYFGADVGFSLFGKSKKYILAVIDKKTNIADTVTGESDTPQKP